MVTVYINRSNKRLETVLKYFDENQISYRVRKVNEETLSYEVFCKILEHTIEGTEEILSTTSQKVKRLIKDGIMDEVSVSGLYRMILKDPTMLDLPFMVDERWVIAVLGKGTDNLTVYKRRKK